MSRKSPLDVLFDQAIEAAYPIAKMLTFALCGKASQAAKVQFISRLGNLCCDFPELASVFVLPASLFFFAVKEVESDSQLRAAASTQLENLKMMMERTRRERLTQFSTN